MAGHQVLVGSAQLLAAAAISASTLDTAVAELSAQGKTPVLAAIEGEPAGILAVADTVKEDSAACYTPHRCHRPAGLTPSRRSRRQPALSLCR